MKRTAVLIGALAGALFMLPVMAVMFAGAQAVGFSFLPFTLFDWLARNLPGAIIRFGINTMVEVITVLQLGPTSDTAKIAEQLMSLGLLPLAGFIAGGLFWALMPRLSKRASAIPGIILGLIVAAPLLVAASTVPQSGDTDPLSTMLWNAGLLILWGLAVNGVYQSFAEAPSTAEEGAPAADVQVIDRRQFLIRVGAGTALITVAGALVGAGLGRLLTSDDAAPGATTAQGLPADLPNANDPVIPAPGTRPEVTALADHYRIDINTLPPVIEEEGYTLPFTTRLTEDGSEVTLKTFTLDEIRAFEPVHAYVTMSCISNRVGGDLISTILWTGVPMQRILEQIAIPAEAAYIKITARDGFYETVALDLIRNDERVMLAYEWAGQPLPIEHGFPLRIHIPNLYGMKQPKWITKMEFIAEDEDGYWVERGWDKEAIARSTSVIDTVATDATFVAGEQTFVPIGGIAWAGDRGISRVQVRVDEGEWQDAQVRAPISDRTWQIWRYDWPYSEGRHLFEVRCVETNGTPQFERSQPTFPAGATGIHSVRTTV